MGLDPPPGRVEGWRDTGTSLPAVTCLSLLVPSQACPWQPHLPRLVLGMELCGTNLENSKRSHSPPPPEDTGLQSSPVPTLGLTLAKGRACGQAPEAVLGEGAGAPVTGSPIPAACCLKPARRLRSLEPTWPFPCSVFSSLANPAATELGVLGKLQVPIKEGTLISFGT